jgi:exonuclease SbcC
MNPLRIEISNMGAVTYADHDLNNISLAAVVGVNGSGKSTTFTTAPTWVLFGTTKNACSVDDMITTGKTDMGGALEFEHRGEIYRVVRTRSKKTKAGKSTLELFRRQNEDWVPESGTTIPETQARIKELLGLDAETFTASSMILQGRANEFTAKPPAQRKAVLQDILGLDIYDWLQERAKKQYQTKASELERLKGQLAQIKGQMRETPKETLQAALTETQSAIVLYEAEIGTLEKQMQDALTKVAEIQAKQNRAKDLDEQADILVGEITERQQLIEQEKTVITGQEKILAHADEIREKAVTYEQIRNQVADIESKRTMIRNIASEVRAMKETRDSQMAKADQLLLQITDLERLLEQREFLQRDAQSYQMAKERLQELEALRERYSDRDTDLRKAQDRYDLVNRECNSQIKTLEDEITRLKIKVSMLENAGCIDPERAACRFLADAQEARRTLPDRAAYLEQYKAESELQLERLQAEVNEALRTRAAVGYDHQEHSKTAELARTLKPSVDKLNLLESKAELLNTLESQRDEWLRAAQNSEAQRQEKQKLMEALDAQLAQLEVAEAQLPELKKWADLLPRLNNTQAAITAAQIRINALLTEIDARNRVIEEKRREGESIRTELAQAEQISPETIKSALSDAREVLKAEQAQAVRLQAQLEKVEAWETEYADITAQMAPLSKEIVRWQTLIRAFGRDGVPAMIIECAVPELERIANEILGQMTRGQNSLFFNTQRDKKDGKGIIETLDIMITDWECPDGRPYETFSGGEQLRIDFALRFALAELLARRAGSRVEWLTIDEGLGSQDREHRELVLDAIKNVADRFKKVIMITHIEEAQGFFEEQIVLRREELL